MVDDRDVLGAEALDEVLRPAPEPRATGDLAVNLAPSDVTVLTNSSPPSIRSSSSRRCASSRATMRV